MTFPHFGMMDHYFHILSRNVNIFDPQLKDVWMDVAMKLFAVALVSCVSMSDAWKWAIAFSLGMAVLVGTCQPYMWPQARLSKRMYRTNKTHEDDISTLVTCSNLADCFRGATDTHHRSTSEGEPTAEPQLLLFGFDLSGFRL